MMQQKVKYVPSNFIKFLAFFLLSCFFFSCANIVNPEGGIKDIIPPKVVKSDPPNFSTTFSGKEVRIQFDEFIQLKDVSKNLLISPPFNNPPECKVKGRSLIIHFEDSLMKNTTYNLYFGDAITDLNEGNPLRAYRFVFSTGPVLDSMEIGGIVTDALTLEPRKEINMLLYDKFEDSIPYKEKPKYVCRSQADGRFIFENLGSGPYKLIALQEKNNNFLFDDKTEEIGFIDSLLMAKPMPARKNDSLVPDSIAKIKTDTPKLVVYLFKENESTIRILKRQVIKPRHISLVFSGKTTSIELQPIQDKPLPTSLKLLSELTTGKDSLTVWISGDSIPDSLTLKVSIDNNSPDTIALNLRRADRSSKIRTKDVKNKVAYTSNTNSSFDLNEKIKISFSYPITSMLYDSIRLSEENVAIKPEISNDSLRRTLFIKYKWKENTKYHLYIPPATIKDLAGYTNDSINLSLVTKQLKDYGKITLQLVPENKENFVVQLVNDKGNVVKQINLREKSTVEWDYLYAGKYKLRLIYDTNNNGIWDPGNYLKKQLPEKVKYFPREFEIRANWELEESWKF